MNGQQNIAPMQNFAILGQVQPKWPIFEVSRFVLTLFAEVSRALRMQIAHNSIQDRPPMLIDLWVYQSAPYLHRGNILHASLNVILYKKIRISSTVVFYMYLKIVL